MNEYICLEEYRDIKGNKYSFCHFKPAKEGRILDLPYNKHKEFFQKYYNKIQVVIIY